MKTQTKYEEIILTEIRTLPMPVLPQILKIVRSFKEGVTSAVKRKTDEVNKSTGFCGAWQDERTVDEIIADITVHRSGFGGRTLVTNNTRHFKGIQGLKLANWYKEKRKQG